MNRIKILDCTLRDGGYVNNWEFGENNIRSIIEKLSTADLDIVECGFLTNKTKSDRKSSNFTQIEDISKLLCSCNEKTEYVCMINYGEYDINDLPRCDGNSITGIRVAFHKKDSIEALDFCKEIVNKGYKLFIQPMVSITYSDTELIELILRANKILPYAFYIVDSFGVMKKNDLMRLFYLIDNNLDKEINIGYHSHNNIQLSYSNAQALVDLKTKRNVIIDSCVLGMGRGAGNLNTELFIEYLNEAYDGHYKAKPLLKIIDEVLNKIYKINYWGYSLPHYMSAKHNCHPNYATYLSSKDTLTIEDMGNILMLINEDKKINFDVEYIDNLYLYYQSHKIDDSQDIQKLEKEFRNKNIIVIAPGKSIYDKVQDIHEIIKQESSIVISVNFIPKSIDVKYVFISNSKRYEQLNNKHKKDIIVTSNITITDVAKYKVNYSDLLVENPIVADNAGLMLIKLLIKFDVKSIKLVGYDGYSYDADENYADKSMAFIKDKATVDGLNNEMIKALKNFTKTKDITFVTKTKYLDLNDS